MNIYPLLEPYAMQAFWGYTNQLDHEKDCTCGTIPYLGSHTALTDIGTNTHPQIDAHLAETTNPHSDNVTISDVITSDLNPSDDVVVNSVLFNNDPAQNTLDITKTISTPIYLPEGVRIGTGTAIKYYISNYMTPTTTTSPWGSNQPIRTAYEVYVSDNNVIVSYEFRFIDTFTVTSPSDPIVIPNVLNILPAYIPPTDQTGRIMLWCSDTTPYPIPGMFTYIVSTNTLRLEPIDPDTGLPTSWPSGVPCGVIGQQKILLYTYSL